MNNKNKLGGDAFLPTLRRRLRPVDAVAVVLVPLVLGTVYLLPVETRRGLAFEYTDPSLVTAFAANFVHLGPEHLFVNVLTYVAAVSVALLLAAMNGTRRRFYAAFLLFMLAFPVALSYLNLAFVRPAVGFGFSGVVMAFVGYLPMGVATYLEERFDVGPRTDLAPVLFFGSLALIAVLSLRSVAMDGRVAALATVGLPLAAALLALVYAVAVYDRTGGIPERVWSGLDVPGYVELAVLGVVLVFAVPFAAFPSNPSTGGGTLNLYTHLFGYALGFILVYAAVEAVEYLRPHVSTMSTSAPRPSPAGPSAVGAASPMDAPAQQPSSGDTSPAMSSPAREQSPEPNPASPLADRVKSARQATGRSYGRGDCTTASRRGGTRNRAATGARPRWQPRPACRTSQQSKRPERPQSHRGQQSRDAVR